ncbi:DUF2637 domain-containing protein [Qaidamihabitans albus]|uniref:DUF2637 domain-containing protein n=1 Tax=Qaidamihabitans albus TaxID=2795733 RepID=UPI0018F202DF|nr:DUF2637 domain-containing protein [Qaidamihabitans albus]
MINAETLVNRVRVAVAVTLGGIGGAAGFTHSHDWAVANGQHGWIAWAVAVVIEGMVVVAGFEIHADRHRPNGPKRRVTFPVVVLVAGFGIQMAAQVALAPRTPAGWLLAAIPALGFLVVVKLLMRRAPAPVPAESRPTPAPPTPSPVPAPEPIRPKPTSPPSRLPGVKLPAHVADQITVTVDEIRAAGNEPTTADIRRVVKVPDAMAARILDQLTPRNGHPIT